ncbi:alpha/beta fold hydrolase [Streptomyces triticiradicis]|uniref:Alpha/beta hydrolase n=1 Tax=Streptomyces triticiradicis TaxID=2651189 RepID=A0A7J5DN65_9ACTN|nr:alpha/beta fold hydrolase [Streptomyces triticiradicis]KAB1990206.1 alpha/beta hydrolase [Streptomyces triticiradicis]
MDAGTTNLGVVFIHGLFSSERTWDPLARLLESDEELAAVTVRRFGYASPRLRRFRPDRRTADYNDLADRLKTFLHYQAAEYDRLLLVAHSQGGLIVQRYLARMINSGQGRQLAKIRGVMLLACPNDGSDFMLPLRSAWWQGNPQVRALTPLDPDVKDAQRTVLERIVYAKDVGASSCPVPFWVFGGSEDKVVVRASAQGAFPRFFMLPGDHFSIIRPTSHTDPAYVALRTHLLEVQRRADPAPGAAASNPSPSAAQDTPWGDSAKAARILEALPPYADWLKTLRTQDFFAVSGRVGRLFREAADALGDDPLQFIDPALHDAATACGRATTDLGEAMTELLSADRVDAEAYEDLSAREEEDARTLLLGEHRRGESELRLNTLRDVFFESYDVLVRLLNERLHAPEGTASPAGGTSTPEAVAARPAAPDAADGRSRVGRGLPRYEHELRRAYDRLRSAGIGEPASDAYLSGATAVQHFAAGEGTGPGWVLSLRDGRAVAVSEPVWNALAVAGGSAAQGDPFDRVGHPTAPGSGPTVIGPDEQRVALEGGSWGRGLLVLGDDGWRWEPQVDLGFDRTPSAANWTAGRPAPQLRLRVLVTLPWTAAEGREVTPERRRDLKDRLPFSRLAGAVTTLSLRRGADLRAASWNPGPYRNAIDSISYSATVTPPDGRPALTGAVMAALPGALQPSTVTCAEIAIQDTAAWAAALPPGTSTRLTLEEVQHVLLASWETAANLLPAAVCDTTTPRWAGPPTVELRLTAEGPHDQPRAGLDTLIDLSGLGPTDRGSPSEMAVTITVSPMLGDTERRKLLRRALVHMLQGFGHVEADEHLLV